MPSTSAKQAKFMRAVANSPKFAKKVGVSQSVGKDFEMADKKRKKFAEGGRAERMRDRRMADIEKDYQRAIARGTSEKEARAKRAQREADARDDYAKRTGADRTETRAAEKAAEARLSAARRGVDKDMKPVSVLSGGDKSVAAKADMPKVDTPKVGEDKPKAGNYDSMSFSAAFRQAMKDKGRGGTFTYRGTPIKLEYASDKKAPRATPPASSAGRSGTTSAGRGPIGTMVDNMLLMGRQVRGSAARGSSGTSTRARGSSGASTPARGSSGTSTSAVPRLGGSLPPPVEIKAPLTGLQAIAKRRREREEARRGPPSDTAKGAASLRALGGAKFAKGGKIDGIAIRGKTRLKRKK